jgi:hypothetical protein
MRADRLATPADRAHALGQGIIRAIRFQLLALVIIGAAALVTLYVLDRQQQHGESTTQHAQASQRIAAVETSLLPVLRTATPADAEPIAAALARIQTPGQSIKVFFKPAAAEGQANLFFIDGTPPVPPARLQDERAVLQKLGVLDRLINACQKTPVPRLTAAAEISAAATVLSAQGVNGCWGVVVSWQDGAPPAFRAARLWHYGRAIMLPYALLAAVVLLTSLIVAVNVRRIVRLHEVDAPASDARHLVSSPAQRDITQEAEQPLLAFDTAAPKPPRRPDELKPVNLSSVVHGFANAEWIRRGNDADRLVVQVVDGIVVEGDEAVIEAVLKTLVENAFEIASPDGRVFVEVNTARVDGRRIAILSVACKGGSAAIPAQSESPATRRRLALVDEHAGALGASVTTADAGPGSIVVLVKFPPAKFGQPIV